jgi:hypothetical protein
MSLPVGDAGEPAGNRWAAGPLIGRSFPGQPGLRFASGETPTAAQAVVGVSLFFITAVCHRRCRPAGLARYLRTPSSRIDRVPRTRSWRNPTIAPHEEVTMYIGIGTVALILLIILLIMLF